MVRLGRRTTRSAAAAALAFGLALAVVGATPGAAQEAPPTTASGAPALPPTTTVPDPATTAPSTTTTAGDPGVPPTAPTTTTGPEPTAPTTSTSAPGNAGAPDPDAAPSSPSAPVAADPAPAAVDGPVLTLDVPPGTLLVDGQAVGVTVTGVGADGYFSVRQCAAGPEPTWQRCIWDDGRVEIRPDGSAHTVLRLDAVLTVGDQSDDVVQHVDCRVDACVAAVETESGTDVVEVPLPFDPDGPLAAPPTATVDPAGPYLHGQSVTVTATGLVWAHSAALEQCAAGATGYTDCDQGNDGAYAEAVDGRASLTLPVSAVIDTVSGPLDCRLAGACELVVTSGYVGSELDPAKSARLPLPFDPATEIVPPTLTVTPADGLVHGQQVTASGSGFLGRYLQFSECADATRPETCIFLDGFAVAGPGGTFSTSVRVSAVVGTPAGEVDCRTSPTPCVLVASPSGATSSRAGRADLRFDLDAPLPPPPSISVTPSTGLSDEAAVHVTGAGFGGVGEFSSVDISVCRTATTSCDEAAGSYSSPEPDGTFTTDVVVAATFTTWDGQEVDCRAAPGCEVTARDVSLGRTATAALAFGPPPTMDDRYRAAVFDAVDVTHDVVYRTTTDASGAAVDLTLDVHEPAGDTVDERPVVVWLSDGWFRPGASAPLTAQADAFARRGYVSVTMDYRGRPGLVCCPTDDIEGVSAAATDATDDAAAGVTWLRDHATDYGIDPDAIVVGGAEGGAIAAFGLAHVVDAPIAAAVPIGGVDFGRPDAGEPPFLAFHGDDRVAPAHLSASACTRARSLGTTCGTVTYPDVYDLLPERSRAVVSRTSDWLADVVLAPAGYVEPSAAGPGSASDAGPGDGLTTTLVSITPLPSIVLAAVGPARLPATGADVARLAALGLALCLLGGAAQTVRRRGLRPSDAGGTRLVVAAVSAVVLVVAGFAVTSALGGDGSDEASGGRPTADEQADADHDAMDHDAMDHDAMDHDAMDHDAMDHDALGHTSTDHGDDGDHDGHAATGATAAGGAHGHGSGTHDGDAHGAGGGHPIEGGHDDGHAHPGVPGEPPHEHPTVPGEPPHEHPQEPHPPDEPHEPPTGFDPTWTADQVAYANQLIADTQAQLVRYDTLAILPLTGFQWIGDGLTTDTYQHWIHLGRISDPRRLDAAVPESLVLRTTPDGPVLEAAMYMLPPGYTLANIPADIAWLPDWHIHDNLCFENGFDLVGVTVNGRCERGSVILTPPMIHVWREPTRCGWFAGVDEFGLQCHHEH